MHCQYHARITAFVVGYCGIENSPKYAREVARFKPSTGTEVFLEYFRTRCNQTCQESLDRTRLIGIINEKKLSKLPDPIEQLIFIPLRPSDNHRTKNRGKSRFLTLTPALKPRKKQPSQDICLDGELHKDPKPSQAHLRKMSSQESSFFNLLSHDRSPIESLEISGIASKPPCMDLLSPLPKKYQIRVNNLVSPTKSSILQSKKSDFSFSDSPTIPANESNKNTSFKIRKSRVRNKGDIKVGAFGTPKRIEGTSFAFLPENDQVPQVICTRKPKVHLTAQELKQSQRSGQFKDVATILADYQLSQAFLASPVRKIASPGQMPRESLSRGLHFKSKAQKGAESQISKPTDKSADSFSKKLESQDSIQNISHLDTKLATENIETFITPTNNSSTSSALFASQTQEFLQVPSAWAALEHKRQLLKKNSTEFKEKSTEKLSKTTSSLCIEKKGCSD